jgi:hypothetical protein
MDPKNSRTHYWWLVFWILMFVALMVLRTEFQSIHVRAALAACAGFVLALAFVSGRKRP